MSSYPNMSYCMWQNTRLALQQCASDFEERVSGEDCEPLSRDELSALRATFDLMRDMLEAANIDGETFDEYDAGKAAVDAITEAECDA